MEYRNIYILSPLFILMSLGDIEFEKQRERLRKSLERQCRKACEERGEEFKIITKVIPFLSNDVPEYLALLERVEKKSRNSSIIVGSYIWEAA